MAVHLTASSDIESKQLSHTSTSFDENDMTCAFYACEKKIYFSIYLNMFYNNDDIFDIQIPTWKILQDILDDIHR